MSEWSIVLAGGEGKRMRPWIRGKFGHPYPKQYCNFYGHKTMLEHTIGRATQLVDPERIVTVIRRRHRVFLGPDGLPGTTIEQPASRDTGPGLLLPVSHILARDPEALIYVFPADHFIFPEDRFTAQMRHAADVVRENPGRLVLMGARPAGAETEYGWIQPGERMGHWNGPLNAAPRRVLAFCEKPRPEVAELLYSRGCLWNTLIFSCRARTLWSLAQIYMPHVHRQFEQYLSLLPQLIRHSKETRREVLMNLYAGLPCENLSFRLLNRAAEHCLVLPLSGIVWSDWGRPERIEESLRILSDSGERLPSLSMDSAKMHA